MAVRAKMRVTGRHEMTNGGHDKSKDPVQVQVTLQAVYGGDDDKANQEWSKWTPSGELKLSITNPAAYEQLKLGRAYFVDLSEAAD